MLAVTYALTGIFAVVAVACGIAAVVTIRRTLRAADVLDESPEAPETANDTDAKSSEPLRGGDYAAFAAATLMAAVFCGINALHWYDADDAETVARLEKHYGFAINEPGLLRTKEVSQWQINGLWQTCYLDSLDMTEAGLWCKDTRKSERGSDQYGDFVSAINFV